MRYVSIGDDWTVGHETSMPVYCSDSGGDVSKEEATSEIIEIVQIDGEAHSERARKDSIDELIRLLAGLDPHQVTDVPSVANQALGALETMARDGRRATEVALRVLATPWGSLWDDSSARCLAANLLGKCGCNNQEALKALTQLLAYGAHGGTDHFTCCEEPVRNAARDALTKLQAREVPN